MFQLQDVYNDIRGLGEDMDRFFIIVRPQIHPKYRLQCEVHFDIMQKIRREVRELYHRLIELAAPPPPPL